MQFFDKPIVLAKASAAGRLLQRRATQLTRRVIISGALVGLELKKTGEIYEIELGEIFEDVNRSWVLSGARRC